MKPNWKPIFFMMGFMFVTAGVLGTLMIILVKPSTGFTHVGAETVFFRIGGHFFLSSELLWYVGAMFFKRLCSFATSILFILSITPSELAAVFNKIGLAYKACTIISLAFRTIPDIARDYTDIRNSLMARGIEMDPKKAKLTDRLKNMVMMLVPLIMSSFGKVGDIANAMDLRGYGKLKKRSWYSEREPSKADWFARGILILIAAFCVYYIVFHRIINPPPVDYWCPWVTP
jgi:energy-coupling factor transport system permease protein